MILITRKLKIYNPKNRIRKLVIIGVVIVFLVLFFLMYISRGVSKLVMSYAEIETRKLTNIVINRAISKQVAEGMEIENLYNMVTDKDGVIQSVDFNTYIVNKILSMITNNIHLNLKSIEEGEIELLEIPDSIFVKYDKSKLKRGIIYEIPLGIVTNNVFLANIGPKIPVRFHIVGSVISNFKTNIKPYGINNALIEVVIHIEVEEQVLLPFVARSIKVASNIPVAIKLIQGRVPTYYQNGMSYQTQPFTMPLR